MENRKTSKIYSILGIVLGSALVVMLIFHLCLPDKSYSEKEKRSLQEMPTLTLKSLENVSFMEAFDSYTAEQIPFRDFWMNLKSGFSLLLGNRESNGAYYGTDGRLIEKFEAYDETLLVKTQEALNRFAKTRKEQEDSNLYMLCVPTAFSVYSEKLPSFADSSPEQDYLDALYQGLSSEIIPLRTENILRTLKETLAEQGEEVYYLTDHHWTSAGAYGVFCALKEETGWQDRTGKSGIVKNDFSGSLVSSGGFIPEKLDAITLYQEENNYVVVRHLDSQTVTASLYDFDKLDTADPYEVFLGGNESLIQITTSAPGAKSLLIFKDSYANCFIPFLIGSYESITVVDPRYYTDSLDSLFLGNRYDDILFLYNANTLSADENLRILLGEDEVQ